MASMAIALQLKQKPSIRNPSFLHFFSSSTATPDLTPNDNPSSSPSQSQSSPSFSSAFSDVKDNLKNKPSPSQQPQSPSSTEEYRKRLSQFRPNGSSPPPSSSQPISFQGLYQKNMLRQSGPATTNTGETRRPFEAIAESLKNLRSNINPGTKSPNFLPQFKEGISLRPRDSNSSVIGGSGILPASIFGKEMNDKEGESPEMKKLYMKSYGRAELGTKLRDLRPKNLKEFSIKELNERLVKLREIEDAKPTDGMDFKALRKSLHEIDIAKQEEKKRTVQRLDILGHLGQTPSFMLSPPKEHLVEKYFHPDNMSSAEKLKIELLKVREEFKISETDCGSAQVQVAQLTTKIKHLADVLHKKDKHSRKGLQEMIQRRKKLLKYLRRTDWDSYCLVLSKLGLRDNPDYKAK